MSIMSQSYVNYVKKKIFKIFLTFEPLKLYVLYTLFYKKTLC